LTLLNLLVIIHVSEKKKQHKGLKMSREIKFRAWQDNEMLNQRLDGVYATKRFLEHLYEDANLMQYIEIKDKSGAEIYEGDIIHLGNTLAPINRQINGQVLYSIDAFDNPCYCILSDECEYIPFHSQNDSPSVWYEVIGNIYENKELLND